jgi:hypothetical protein
MACFNLEKKRGEKAISKFDSTIVGALACLMPAFIPPAKPLFFFRVTFSVWQKGIRFALSLK